MSVNPLAKNRIKEIHREKTQNPGGGRWKDLIDLIAQLHSGNLKKQDWLEMSPDIEEAISTCFMHSCVDLVSLRHAKMTGWYNHQRLYRSKIKLKSSAKGEPSEPPENVQNCQLTIPPPQKKVLHTKFAECLRLDGICNCVSSIPKTQGPKHFLVSKFWESPPKVSSKRDWLSRKFNQNWFRSL